MVRHIWFCNQNKFNQIAEKITVYMSTGISVFLCSVRNTIVLRIFFFLFFGGQKDSLTAVIVFLWQTITKKVLHCDDSNTQTSDMKTCQLAQLSIWLHVWLNLSKWWITHRTLLHDITFPSLILTSKILIVMWADEVHHHIFPDLQLCPSKLTASIDDLLASSLEILMRCREQTY